MESRVQFRFGIANFLPKGFNPCTQPLLIILGQHRKSFLRSYPIAQANDAFIKRHPRFSLIGAVYRNRPPFEKFLESRLFVSLGMKDSHFFLPAEKHAPLATIYKKGQNGLEKTGDETIVAPTRVAV